MFVNTETNFRQVPNLLLWLPARRRDFCSNLCECNCCHMTRVIVAVLCLPVDGCDSHLWCDGSWVQILDKPAAFCLIVVSNVAALFLSRTPPRVLHESSHCVCKLLFRMTLPLKICSKEVWVNEDQCSSWLQSEPVVRRKKNSKNRLTSLLQTSGVGSLNPAAVWILQPCLFEVRVFFPFSGCGSSWSALASSHILKTRSLG